MNNKHQTNLCVSSNKNYVFSDVKKKDITFYLDLYKYIQIWLLYNENMEFKFNSLSNLW